MGPTTPVVLDSTSTEVVISLENQVEALTDLIKKESRRAGVSADLALGIAFCESSLKHYNQDGSVRRGKINRADVGLFQINEKFHGEKSRELGYDIETPKGNTDYAIWLLANYGTRAWDWSRPCWDKD